MSSENYSKYIVQTKISSLIYYTEKQTNKPGTMVKIY